MTSTWNPLTVDQIFDRFSAVDVDWWVAGGHAIDLFLGWHTRAHDDIDIEMFRSDTPLLFEVFEGWDLHAVSAGRSVPLALGDTPDREVFAVWARSSTDEPWAVEIILADGDSATWRFRRDPDISLDGEALIRHTSSGIPYGTPEVQLLYKSKQFRPKDDVDLARVLHEMSDAQRSWLVAAIRRSDADHPWIAVLENANAGHRE